MARAKKVTDNTPKEDIVEKQKEIIPEVTGKGTNTEFLTVAEKQQLISKTKPAEEQLKVTPATKKTRKGYIIAVGHNQEIVLLRSPNTEEISRRLSWRLPANFASTLEVGQVYEVEAKLTNRKDMDFLYSTLEVVTVKGLIPTE